MTGGKKRRSGLREFFTVLGIAVVIAGVMTLLALVPPVSILYRWLEDRDLSYVWTGLVAGFIGGVLSYCRIKEKKKEAAADGAGN